MKFNQYLFAGFVVALAVPAHTLADDTDIYLNPAQNNIRPQVLIIFDNSASMDTMVEGLPGGYKPNVTYTPLDSANSYQDDMIYFTVGTGLDESGLGIPDSPSETNRFNLKVNACNEATKALTDYGRFSGHFGEYSTNGNGKGTWQLVKENSGNEVQKPIDCWEDILATNSSNNNVQFTDTVSATGYPQNSVVIGSGNNALYSPWGAKDSASAANLSGGTLITLYTANYLRWYRHYQKDVASGTTDPNSQQTRLAIAKDAISSVISTVPSIDFGLAVYNMNYPREYDRDGGRIVAGIKSRTAAEKTTLINTITQLPADTNTPLCETLFEAYSYFSGGKIQFGHSDSNYKDASNKIDYTANQPKYDTSIESNGSYISPLSKCNKVAHIIYITDGAPVLDDAANDLIKGLGGTPYTYNSSGKSSYLPALAGYMFNHDMSSADGFQRVITHTIGFSLGEDKDAAEPLLIETAKRSVDSKGEVWGTYSPADNTVELVAAITKLVAEINKTGQRFSAPGVAFSSADPTRTLESAYYALFEPSQSPKWTGNLKKLKVNSSGVLVDKNNKAAIDSSGGITSSACTIWSTCSTDGDVGYVDESGIIDGGNVVSAGGAARQIDPNTRTMLSDLDSGLVALTVANASKFAGGSRELAALLGLNVTTTDSDAAVTAELDKAFAWIYGKNVDVASTDANGNPIYTSIGVGLGGTRSGNIRADIMGDPLHSQPLAIDFGDHTMIYVGTNHGVMHAFNDSGDSVAESWAFMPNQLFSNLSTIRRNDYSFGHSEYGLDGSPVSYIERDDSAIKTAWLYFGMRRGGQSYFAMDVKGATPTLKWTISNTTAGFSNLGQTWSTPVVTKVPINDGKPVLIFGGGYNPGYDAAGGKNSFGRDVYIVDADTGTLLHTFGIGGTDTPLPNITDSIVGSIATLDSNGDGITDRLYASDLGGNVWRMDMPASDKTKWSAFMFASAGGAYDTSDDRRFFYEPTVAQTYFTDTTEVMVTDADGNTEKVISYQNVPYDAVTLGSGNRADPLGTSVNDKFFVIQDRNVATQTFGSATGQTAVPDPIIYPDNLYDVTQAAPSTESEKIAFSAKRGWYYSFPGLGEKSLSPSVIIKGKVYFTSFTPTGPAPDPESCSVASVGKLYTLDLHTGLRFSQNYYIDICDNCIPQPPKIITPPIDPEHPEVIPDPVLIIGAGTCDEKGENCTGTVNLDSGLETNKIYYHINE
uniref:Type IV pilin biogenesis protein, putative n=1 Tax=Shewanella sp. (strain MR-7) TaxID=60481 RepID=Q0HS89_SHESR